MNSYYEIVIFTASQSYYANEVISLIDPSNELITYRLFQEHCYSTPAGHMLKDLRILRNREISNIVIVDNATYSYSLQLENGVPIIPFFRDKKDRQLDRLGDYLVRLARSQDVRERIKEDFKIETFKRFNFDIEILKCKLLETND